MMVFSVSVIIPVYNSEQFVEKAILSALEQPEVKEVVIVNDGSTDKSLQIIKKIQKQNDKVKIYHHLNKENKGRSASRNLGIKKASENYIAFLDADDFYLENRFKNDLKVFKDNINADGVYNAIGAHFYKEATSVEREKQKITTLSKEVDPEKLFDVLFQGKYGHFSILGLTVKASVFIKTGLFNEVLKVAEDTELFLRMSLCCRLFSGVISEPLAVRGVHDNNVSNRVDLYSVYRPKMYETLFLWTGNKNINNKYIDRILNVLWLLKYKEGISLKRAILYWCFLFFNNSKYLFSTLSIKYFPVVRLRQKLFTFFYKKK